MTITLPIRTVSEANQHAHWRARSTRAKCQRSGVALALYRPLTPFRRALAVDAYAFAERATEGNLAQAKACAVPPHVVVTLTRIAPRSLDSDNLAGSQKHVRDGVADALGIDDRDSRVAWCYAQRNGVTREYAVEIVVSVVS